MDVGRLGAKHATTPLPKEHKFMASSRSLLPDPDPTLFQHLICKTASFGMLPFLFYDILKVLLPQACYFPLTTPFILKPFLMQIRLLALILAARLLDIVFFVVLPSSHGRSRSRAPL